MGNHSSGKYSFHGTKICLGRYKNVKSILLLETENLKFCFEKLFMNLNTISLDTERKRTTYLKLSFFFHNYASVFLF